MKYFWLIAVLFSVTIINVQAEPKKKYPDAAAYELTIKAPTKEIRSELAKFMHIDNISSGQVTSVLNEFDYKLVKGRFSHLIIKEKLIPIPHFDLMTGTPSFPRGYKKYHTYDEVISELKELERKFPKIVTLIDIGNSVEGRSLLGVKIHHKITKRVVKKSTTPAIAFLGTHHAREHLSTEIPLMLAKHLAENFESDAAIKKLIQTREIFIIPLVNPDGAVYDIENRRFRMWRKNRYRTSTTAYGIDLNRNYGFKWGTGGSSRNTRSDVYMGPKPFSEPETQAVRDFIKSNKNIKILLSFHTFSELILYPWGHKDAGVTGKDAKVFTTMAKTMSKWNGYKPMQASGLYIASGDTCDWAYGELGIFCFTFELSPKNQFMGGGFYPKDKIIPRVFKDNLKPALYLMEHANDPYRVIKK